MSSYIQDRYPLSRLTLVYRMQIDGKLADEVLPFRTLVLGDFSGQTAAQHLAKNDSLAERRMASIPYGTRWQDALGGLKVTLPLDQDDTLKPFITYLQGDFQGQVTCDLGPVFSADPAATTATLTGKVTLSGKGLDETAPIPTLATTLPTSNGIGDFTGSVDFTCPVTIGGTMDAPTFVATQALTTATISGKVDGDLTGDAVTVVAPTALKLTASLVTNPDGSHVIRGTITGKAWIKLTIPVRDLDSFSPDTLSNYIPEIRRVILIGKMIDELSANIVSKPALKSAVSKLIAPTSTLAALKTAFATSHPFVALDLPAPATDELKGELPAAASDLVKAMFDAKAVTKTTAGTTELVALSAPTVGAKAETSLVLRDQNSYVPDEDRFVNTLAALLVNLTTDDIAKVSSINTLMAQVHQVRQRLDGRVNSYLTTLLSSPTFRTVEQNWRGIADLCSVMADPLVRVDVLDVGKDELGDDLKDNSVDLFKSALFKKVYHDEYDRYGGKPFGAMIGLYQFDVVNDLPWIQAMADVSNLTHCPFISAAGPASFGAGFTSMAQVDAIPDLEIALAHPRYGKWEVFRKTDGAGYVGLTLPGYLLRLPWGAEAGQFGNGVSYDELQSFDEIKDSFVDKDVPYADYLYGNSAILFGQNLIRSFQQTGWCQHIRGERGGGFVEGLNVHAVEEAGRLEYQPPLELALPDFKELQLSNHGFIPLVWKKDSTDATFFGARSTKKAIAYAKELDTQNADMVCNLAYSFSVTRIAHYIKALTRPYIGTVADGPYLQNLISTWLGGYVTTIVNPDELTVQKYPFAAIQVDVIKKPGPLGWYTATVSILPHIQFEGMRVELRLEAALGGAK